MSTLVKDRKESKIEFIENMRQLVAHTWKYISKFPKTTRFIFQTKLCDYVNDAFRHIISANSIYIKTKEDVAQRRTHFNEAIGLINSFEALLDIVQLSYKQYVTDYGWSHWGDLIIKEISLLKGIIKKDETIKFD